MNRSRSAPWSVVAALLSACAAGSPAVQRGTVAQRPDTFVSLAEVDPSIAIELRYFGSHNFLGHPVRGYKAEKCLLTRRAVVALKNVQDDLRPFGLSLKAYDCYRPQRAVDTFVTWAKDFPRIASSAKGTCSSDPATAAAAPSI